MDFQGAIFDLDGTLLESMGKWESVSEDYLRSKGAKPAADLRQTVLPLTLPQAAEHMIKAYQLADTSIADVVAAINNLLKEFYRLEAPLKANAREFLQHLKARGVKMCVATATDRELVELALDRLQISNLFDFIITVREAGAGKHQPDIYLQAAERLGIAQEQIVVFEDALHAIRTAKDAGFRVVGLADASSNHQQAEIEPLCERYLTNFNEWGGS